MKATKPISVSSRGYYTVTVLNKDSKRVENKCSKVTTQNVVTDNGAYYQLFSSHLFYNLYAAVGTGTTERTKTSSALGNDVAGRSAGVGASRAGTEIDNLDGTSTLTITREFTFPLGSKVGTFSEVGLYSEASGGIFVAGQLIKDEFGNPTTITLLADEQLIVAYTLEWTVPNKPQLAGTGSVTDALSNVYRYEVYLQPYFVFSNVGENDVAHRYRRSEGLLALRAANGTTHFSINEVNHTWTHTRAGNIITSRSSTAQLAPSDGTATDIVYAVLTGYSAYSGPYSDYFHVDPATNLASTGFRAYNPVVIKFLDPVTKTSNDTFAIAVEYQIELT